MPTNQYTIEVDADITAAPDSVGIIKDEVGKAVRASLSELFTEGYVSSIKSVNIGHVRGEPR